MHQPPGHRALRRGRYSLHGQVYLLTTTTDRRTRHFADTDMARTAARCCGAAATWGDARLLCWVLMPDHWHGLLQLGTSQDLSPCVNRFKAQITKALRTRHTLAGRLWQPGFHDHAVRREESLLAIARYLVLNPVRAGLVARVGDYPYWNAIWF